jgi:lysophospholipase L1-like esterase
MNLKGKIIDFLGDSITEGAGVADLSNRYDNVILKECELKAVHNYGIGGTRFAHQSVPSEKPRHDLCFCGRAYDLNPEADIIIVYGGVNDYLHGDAPIGKSTDCTPTTFYGAVHFLMNFLKEKYSNQTIIFMTPARCCFHCSDIEVSNNPIKKSDALPLLEYVSIIKEVATEHKIPVLDLYHNLGINPNQSEDHKKYTVDGLHFNDAGHHMLAHCVIDFLNNL